MLLFIALTFVRQIDRYTSSHISQHTHIHTHTHTHTYIYTHTYSYTHMHTHTHTHTHALTHTHTHIHTHTLIYTQAQHTAHTEIEMRTDRRIPFVGAAAAVSFDFLSVGCNGGNRRKSHKLLD